MPQAFVCELLVLIEFSNCNTISVHSSKLALFFFIFFFVPLFYSGHTTMALFFSQFIYHYFCKLKAVKKRSFHNNIILSSEPSIFIQD